MIPEYKHSSRMIGVAIALLATTALLWAVIYSPKTLLLSGVLSVCCVITTLTDGETDDFAWELLKTCIFFSIGMTFVLAFIGPVLDRWPMNIAGAVGIVIAALTGNNKESDPTPHTHIRGRQIVELTTVDNLAHRRRPQESPEDEQ